MPELTAAKRARLPDSAFAYVDANGKRRLPINDEPHVRNALARFDQVAFESEAAKERARKRLLVAAKRYGIVPIGFITGQLRGRPGASKFQKGDLPSGTLALLLTDIEGSTVVLRKLGDAYGGVLDDHREIIRAAVVHAGGHEVEARADEYFAVFEQTSAALNAALAIQRSFSNHPWPDATSLRVRIGIHTGTPAFRRGDYIGLPVHVAARVSSAAHGGQILLSSASYQALDGAWPDGVTAASIGRYVLRGLPSPEELFQVAAADLKAEFPPPRLVIPEKTA